MNPYFLNNKETIRQLNPLPLVSIVMPSYNSSIFIEDTIDSVLNQFYKNFELLVVDDCSKDNTVDIVKEYQKKDNRIKLF